ncbi:DUF397 domain-containing protein [Streptomyces erythrochromogenes]|uniref:DUF397 domain-containing protein n=1 Tax=Streptomyces erythrochromogenes TaxID=285574 RepID=UPI003867B344|nr:DUF397 domain-containing protein [Streptomyces erythrochromogenes]WSR88302.1 DUF397 domain-containing protein [Streptomyces erythrochromogenes]
MTENLKPTEPVLTWHKSSYSDGAGNNCVEVATCGRVHVRDSKQNLNTVQPSLTVAAAAWTRFIEMVQG